MAADVYAKLAAKGPDAVWAVNQKFLDNAIARGDRFLLTNPTAKPGTGFEQEIKYLLDQGYRYVTIAGETYLEKGP